MVLPRLHECELDEVAEENKEDDEHVLLKGGDTIQGAEPAEVESFDFKVEVVLVGRVPFLFGKTC